MNKLSDVFRAMTFIFLAAWVSTNIRLFQTVHFKNLCNQAAVPLETNFPPFFNNHFLIIIHCFQRFWLCWLCYAFILFVLISDCFLSKNLILSNMISTFSWEICCDLCCKASYYTGEFRLCLAYNHYHILVTYKWGKLWACIKIFLRKL